jgi:hypothetical protein
MATATTPRPYVGGTRLLEYAGGNDGLRVDRVHGVIRGVKVASCRSRNDRYYPAQTLLQAIPLYEGVDVYCDHTTPIAREARSIQGKIGWLSNVRQVPDGALVADLNLLRSHPITARVLEAAERNPHLFALSHHVQADVRSENGQQVVRRVVSVESVDIVSAGGMHDSLFEHKRPRPSASRSGGAGGAVRDPLWRFWEQRQRGTTMARRYREGDERDEPGRDGDPFGFAEQGWVKKDGCIDPDWKPGMGGSAPAVGKDLCSAIMAMIDGALDNVDQDILDPEHRKLLDDIKELCKQGGASGGKGGEEEPPPEEPTKESWRRRGQGTALREARGFGQGAPCRTEEQRARAVSRLRRIR